MSEFEQQVLKNFTDLKSQIEEQKHELEKKIEDEIASLAQLTQREFEHHRRDFRDELRFVEEKLTSKIDGLQRRLDAVDDLTRSHSH